MRDEEKKRRKGKREGKMKRKERRKRKKEKRKRGWEGEREDREEESGSEGQRATLYVSVRKLITWCCDFGPNLAHCQNLPDTGQMNLNYLAQLLRMRKNTQTSSWNEEEAPPSLPLYVIIVCY